MSKKGPNRAVTQQILRDHKKHGDAVFEELDEILEAGQIQATELDLVSCLEHDFGVGYRRDVMTMGDDAMEAIITSGTFNKMVPKIIRTALAEQPKEEYFLLNRVTIETRGECEDGYEDHGVFSDPQAEEICELQKPPMFGVATDFMTHPKGKQYGLGFAFTREAVCRDPNSFIQQQIPKISDAHNEKFENQLIDLFVGYTNTYNRSGTDYDTYYAADGTSTPFGDGSGGPWVNAQANDLTCPADFQSARNLFYDFRDMVHGRPIPVPMTGLSVVTSPQKADAVRPKLLATAIEDDVTCNGGDSVKYIMTAQVANQMTFDLLSYQRLVDRIALRWGVTTEEARNWWWLGNIPEFMSWVYNIRPTVTRCPQDAESCKRRIVAQFTSLSKGYGYIRNPYRGMWFTPVEESGT